MSFDNFIDIPFSESNLDRYLIRTSILNALRESAQNFNGDLLDIGCGKMPYKDFVLQTTSVRTYSGLDLEAAITYDKEVKPDFMWDGITMPLESNQFDTAIATEVLEHCFHPNIVLRETWRVLKPRGMFFFTVPFLWPLHEVPNDAYRYTPFSLQALLQSAGFQNIVIKPTGGWDAALAQMLGLWVTRSAIGEKKRKALAKIIKPVMATLIKKDGKQRCGFEEGSMITGFSGTAYKSI